MSNNVQNSTSKAGGPLPDSVLKNIVGGRKGEEAKAMDWDRAVALTAGGEGAQNADAKPGSTEPKLDDATKASIKDLQNLHGTKLKLVNESVKSYVKGSGELNSEGVKTTVKSSAADAGKSASEKAAEEAKEKAEKDKFSDGFDKGAKVANKALTLLQNERAKAAAKENGFYEKTSETRTTSGGVSKATVEHQDGSSETKTGVMRKTVLEEHERWDSSLGKGANHQYTPKYEIGYENKTTYTDKSGDKVVETKSGYAEAKWENKAGYSKSATHFAADASTTVSGHFELNNKTEQKIFGLDNTTTRTVAGHAEAGAKGHFHVGIDGIKTEGKAHAEATLSGSASNSTKIGNYAANVTGTLYTQAKAEASGGIHVGSDPKQGFKTKVGGTLEATAGVGANISIGGTNENGNGAKITAHVKAGSAGVKFEPDLTVKDGKAELKLGVGGFVGTGAVYDIEIKGDYKKALDGAQKAIKDIGDDKSLISYWPNYQYVKVGISTLGGFFG